MNLYLDTSGFFKLYLEELNSKENSHIGIRVITKLL